MKIYVRKIQEDRKTSAEMAENGDKKRPYSRGQMEALAALCDTLLPSIDISSHDDFDQSLIRFYLTSASMAGTPHHLGVLLGEKIQHPKNYLSKLALMCLSTRIGTFILCGRKSLSTQFPYFLRFAEVSNDKRKQILFSWSDSCIFILRILYTAIKIFTLLLFFTQVNENGENITWKPIGYCKPPDSEKEKQKLGHQISSVEEKFGPLYNGIISFKKSMEGEIERLRTLGFPVTTLNSKNTSLVVKCDVVVLGSGAGGGVVAGVAAKAGYKVVVVEKGKYFARSSLSLVEGQAMDEMYLGHGVLATENMDIMLLAGSTVGGGSTINWSASIRTPPHVMKDWSESYQLELFASGAYDKALDVICQRMGVQSEIEQEGFNNMVLRRGCQNLGYPVESIPRNSSSDHYCGWCCLGCKDGRKKGVSETWLVDMVESGNGVVLTECEAVKVITRRIKGEKRATGVAFTFHSDRGVEETAIVESQITVVACGAICTPPLLRRSGLKNANIGKNLHLHPVVLAWGYFSDTPTPTSDAWPGTDKRSYEGGIMTAMSKMNPVPDSSTYDAIIQTPALHPGMFSALMPWLSGADIRNRMLKFSRTAHIFTLARDRGSGVVVSPNHISYTLDKYDQENLSTGIERVLRILAAAGAEEIGTHNKKGRLLKVKEAGTEEFERFVKEESSRPLKNLASPICSAHQMGSCRMGTDPKRSAVRPNGETWEVHGLYVADSSVFPTALGVNPMVTVQAIAYCTAQSILEALRRPVYETDGNCVKT